MSEQDTTEAAADVPSATAEGEFQITKLYIKDVSFESPRAVEVFSTGDGWKPDINLQLNTEVKPLQQDMFEVVLALTVTAKLQDETAFLVELHQAGVFVLKGFEKAAHRYMLGSYCPQVLFPFARQAIADLVAKGGFPQLLLSPINFDALYAKHLKEQQTPSSTEH